jgi:hypothetical protein
VALQADGKIVLAGHGSYGSDTLLTLNRHIGDPLPVPAAQPQPPTANVDRLAPFFRSLRMSLRRFRLGTLLPRFSQRRRTRATVISFDVSEAGRAELRFARAQRGRRVGRRCRRATRRLRNRRRCTRYVTVRPSLTAQVKAGVNRVRFTGRLTRRRSLRPGRHRLTILVTDAAGNRSAPRNITFTLLPRPRRR